MTAPTASRPRTRATDRLRERAQDRARTLHTMRGSLMAVVSVIVVGYVGFAIVWLILFAMGIQQAASVVGVASLILNIVVNTIVLFLAWITLEALGRIERETDRVQQFMDNVYRRLN